MISVLVLKFLVPILTNILYTRIAKNEIKFVLVTMSCQFDVHRLTEDTTHTHNFNRISGFLFHPHILALLFLLPIKLYDSPLLSHAGEHMSPEQLQSLLINNMMIYSLKLDI